MDHLYEGRICRASPPAPTKTAEPRLRLFDLVEITPSLWRMLGVALALTAGLQAIALTSPLYMRLVVDDVMRTGDLDLLSVLALCFCFVAAVGALGGYLRDTTLQRINIAITGSTTTRVFNHLLTLPLRWHQKQQTADILSRMQSVEQVRATIASGVSVAIDGVLSATTLCLILAFDWRLALVCLAGACAFATVRVLAIRRLMRLNQCAIAAAAADQGYRLETIRGIQSVKSAGAEPVRAALWARALEFNLASLQTLSMTGSMFGAIQALLGGVVSVLFVYVGARTVLAGGMTLGALTAVLAYQMQFSQRAMGLVEQLASWKALDVHLDRLQHVLGAPPDGRIAGRPIPQAANPVSAAVELRNLAFRHGDEAAPLFQELNARVEPGEHLVVTGPSGSGKSTLLKIVSGLYPPSAGEMLLNGRPFDGYNPDELRSAFGAVLQGDAIFSDTIAANVALRAETPDLDRVRECLRIVGLTAEVVDLDKAEQTHVGDGGVNLSAGQVQRLLLARALYREPSVLLLDEVTAHLDADRELHIDREIQRLGITRISISHSPRTIAAADRVIALGGWA